MRSDASQPRSSTIAASPAWPALVVLGLLIVVEAAIVAGGFGPWLMGLRGKQLPGLGLLGGLVLLWGHIEGHREAYASVRISWPLVAGQVVSFAAFLVGLGWMASAGCPLDGALVVPLGCLLALVPASFTLAAIAPDRRLGCQLFGAAALGFGGIVVAWNVGALTQSFWAMTSGTTMRLVELSLSALAGSPVVRPETFVIGTGEFRVRIAPSCSGFHGIGLVTGLLAVSLCWFRDRFRFPRALLLLPLGAALMWAVNVVRITALILVGIWISPEIAVDGFHSMAGWLGFLTVGLGILWTASRSRFFTLPESAPADGRPSGDMSREAAGIEDAGVAAGSCRSTLPVSSCILPFLALTAMTMLTRVFTGGFDFLYPLRVITVVAVLWRERDSLPWRDCRLSLQPIAIGTAVFALWLLLAPRAADHAALQALDPFQMGQPGAALWLLFRVVGAGVTVPIAEELFFRGFLTRRCIAADAERVPIGQFSWFSFVVSSAAFGLLHGDAWLAGIVAGAAYAIALYTRRRLFDAVLAHATTNALLSVAVIATGSWSEWR